MGSEKERKGGEAEENKSGNSGGSNSGGSNGGGSGGNKSKLQLTDGMKQALVSQGNMTADEATALWNSVMDAQGN